MDQPSAPVLVRAASAADVGDILAIWTAAGAHPTITDTAEAVARLIDEQPGALLVAEVGAQVAGTLIAAWDGWRGNLYRLAVLPSQRRRGIGRTLVMDAARRLRERGVQRVSALVVADDAPALDFWDSLADAGLRRDPLPKERYIWNL
jgi:ribosomal protein S18 acetylase RimI-like enzyme